tara:strand:+ start:768 stop:977 length:210 start_codon:yes stop_codon:yes gene_type:complete
MISLTNVDPELTAPECDFLIDVLTLTRENNTNKMDRSAQKFKVNVRTIKKKLGLQADIADGEVDYIVRG